MNMCLCVCVPIVCEYISNLPHPSHVKESAILSTFGNNVSFVIFCMMRIDFLGLNFCHLIWVLKS